MFCEGNAPQDHPPSHDILGKKGKRKKIRKIRDMQFLNMGMGYLFITNYSMWVVTKRFASYPLDRVQKLKNTQVIRKKSFILLSCRTRKQPHI